MIIRPTQLFTTLPSIRNSFSCISRTRPINQIHTALFRHKSFYKSTRQYSMAPTKQFTLYGHGSGPNPWKVVVVLNELNLDFDLTLLDFRKGEQKSEKILRLNPNGRVPILIDHKNNDFTIWESGAIIQYLVGKYDTEKKLHTGNFETDALISQWLMFQVSGQGPYFGQLAWFTHFHSEKIPSAIERYTNEVVRVTGVLEIALTGHDYLVGDKLSYADLAFIQWNVSAYSGYPSVKEKYEAGEFPNVKKWMERLTARESVVKQQKQKADLAQAH